MESRTKKAKRNIVYELLNTFVKTILPFITRTVLIHVLGKMYLGLNSLFVSILQTLSLAELGVGSAIVYSMYKPFAENDTAKVNAYLNLYRKIYRIIGLGILCAGLLLLPFLPRLIKDDLPSGIHLTALYLINLGNTVISYWVFSYKRSLLRANQRSDVLSRIDMWLNMGASLVRCIILLAFKNYYLYCIVAPLSTILRNLIVEYRTRQMYPQYFCEGKVEKEEITAIKKNVGGLLSYKISGVFRNSFDSIILSAFIGLGTLACYNNYYYVLNTILTTISTVTNSITAGIGNKLVVSPQKDNYSDFKKFLLLYMWFGCWCTVSLFCLYQPFIRLWVGEEMLFSDGIKNIFCVYFFARMMNTLCYVYRQAAGIWWEDRFRPIMEALANLTLNILLVRRFGVIGVMLSTIAAMLPFNTIWGSWILYKNVFTEEKYRDYLIRLGYYAVIASLSCRLTGWVCGYIAVENLFAELVLRGMVCVVVPNVLYLAAFSPLPEFRSAVGFARKVLLHT